MNKQNLLQELRTLTEGVDVSHIQSDEQLLSELKSILYQAEQKSNELKNLLKSIGK